MWSAVAIALGLLSKIVDLIPKKSPVTPPADVLRAKALEKELEEINAPKPRSN
jgi:hypothetical protein